MPLGLRLVALGFWGGLGLIAGSLPTAPALAQPATGQEIEVATNTEGALDLARKALSAGRPDLAVSIARQILASDPENTAAHMLLAAALTRSGHAPEAMAAAKAGFRLSDSPEDHFEAAYLAAEAASLAGRPMAAKLWLRWADTYAPTERHAAVIERAYSSVSAQSRLSFGLSVFGGPSDNVNGGSLHDTFWFYGLPIPITQAIPGQVLGGAVQASYRVSDSLQLWLGWTHQEVILGVEARALDPDVRAQDFRRDEVRLGFAKDWQNAAGTSGLQLELSTGRRWQGGAVSADISEAGLMARHLLGKTWVIGAKLHLEDVAYADRPSADSLTGRLTFSTSHMNARFGATTLEIGVADVASNAAGIAWRGPVAKLGWKPILPTDWVAVKVDLSVEQRDYWRTPDFEPDLAIGAAVTADLPKLGVMGFDPSVTVSSSRTRSQVVVRDQQEVAISFGFSSKF